jgi:hypothetical protein
MRRATSSVGCRLFPDAEHLAGGVKLALIGNNLVNQSGLTFFKVALQ